MNEIEKQEYEDYKVARSLLIILAIVVLLFVVKCL